MLLNFKNKNVLITGASMGIGKSLSRYFAREGANLALADLPQEKGSLEKCANELRDGFGISTWTFYGDLTLPNGPEDLHDNVVKTVGDIHVLVNNAGIAWYGFFKEMPLEILERMILLNSMAYAKLTRLFLPAMIEKDAGAILNLSSCAAFQPLPTLALYSGVKAFTQSFSESIRLELPRKSKVIVSTLNPPFTRTSLLDKVGFPMDYIPRLLNVMEVDVMTKAGYKAFKKGKLRFVPGIKNKILHLGLVRYLPHDAANFVSRLCTHRLSHFLPNFLVGLIVKWRSK